MTFCTSTPSGGVCFVVSLFPTIAWTSLPASDGSLVKWTPPQCILIKYYLYCNLVFILHTFESRIECSFSSSTGQNLGFDDKFRCPGFEEAKIKFRLWMNLKEKTYNLPPSTPSASVSAIRNRCTASPCSSINCLEEYSWRFNLLSEVWETRWATRRSILKLNKHYPSVDF